MSGLKVSPIKNIKKKSPLLLDLPSELLLHILSCLDYRNLCRCEETCKQLQEISRDESLWKQQCKQEFLLEECSEEEGWLKQFQSYHSRFARFHSAAVYRTIRRLWDRLEKYLQENDQEMLDALRAPCDYSEIQIAEQKMMCRFPADLRCSLQIHNGQQMRSGIGSEGLLDAASMARVFDNEGELPGCVPLTCCYISRKSQYIALNDVGGFAVGEIFYPTPDQRNSDVDIFITGKSYLEWFTDLVETLENNRFPRIEERIYRFYEEPECVATTNGCFTVKARTSFMPDLSTVNPPHFFYTYRITMSMDADANEDHSCQLETRHWIVTDEDGHEERVDGPGVIGQFPVMTPGAEFSWISCTRFNTTYGNMKGFFTMKNLKTGEELEIVCPTFHMKCLPYKTASERWQHLLHKKKNL